MKRALYFLFSLLIIFNIFVTFWLPINGDIFYNQDSARDFLLLEEIIEREPFTLIGPRTLGISGIFHGPLWLYINVPVYILGGGNPAVIGVFWGMLFSLSVVVLWYVAKKLFDKLTAFLSTLLYSSIFASPLHNFNNTFGAVVIFPFYFYIFNLYINTLKVRYLILSFLLVGLIIQFQMAFGIPILILQVGFLLYFLMRKKLLKHFMALPILFIPLSTFILFELRHQFLQTQSFLTYITSRQAETFNFLSVQTFFSRVSLIFKDSIGQISGREIIISIFVILLFIFGYKKIFSQRKNSKKNFYLLFLYLYIGYWVITYFYTGQIWIWYHWAFAPVMVIIFSSLYRYINKWMFFVVFVLCFGLVMKGQIQTFFRVQKEFSGKDHYSWVLFLNGAKNMYEESGQDFGYYIFEDDMLGYRGRYAINYAEKFYRNQGNSNTKKPVTYLFVASAHDYRWWKKTQVKIDRKPNSVTHLSYPYRIERYDLNIRELSLPSDPNLIDTLHFR
ncbi:hypothetical protein HYW54_03060 [Candidatus Gottesmanbacteria bacterium]|nr:hypothetical protein [Candidatus Gottesmanbacteria bacterium]